MLKNQKLKKLAKQFTKFALIGFMNTILNLAITYFLIFCFQNATTNKTLLTFLANLIGFVFTTLSAYYFNNKFVFKKTNKKNLWPLAKTYICYSTTFVLSFILTKIFTNLIGLNVFLVPAISLVFTVPLNFLINKFWSFA